MQISFASLFGGVLAAIVLASASPTERVHTVDHTVRNATSVTTVNNTVSKPSSRKCHIQFDQTGIDVDDYYEDNCIDDGELLPMDGVSLNEPSMEDDISTSTPSMNSTHTMQARAAGGRWTVYADNWLTVSTFPTAAQIDGYTHFILAFWISDKGPVDNGLSWARMSTTQRRKLKQRLTSGGAKLMIAAGGATDHPTTAGLGPEKRAQLLANYVKRYGFDGVDVNYEDFAAFNANDGRAERWVIRFTRELRKQLPSHEISHGPVAPLFQPNRWGGGGYLRINNEVGGLINFYNIQFYNQGDDIYTSCYQIMERSHPAVPNTSVFQMIRNRVPGEKIVVGKPAGAKDASNGFYSAPALGSCLRKYAGRNGYQGSAMVWQWANAGRAWVHTVRGIVPKAPNGK